MPQNSQHPIYKAMLPQWQRCRHAIQGTDAVKAQGELYLPKPSGMTQPDYNAYRKRATWFGATARTHESYGGMVFRQPPVVDVPPRVVPHLMNITLTGVSFHDFAKRYFDELTLIGYAGMLLDLPPDDVPVNRLQPQWSLYHAEAIVNWRSTLLTSGETVLSHVVLQEYDDQVNPNDPYEHSIVAQWRELSLENGVYVQRLWRETAANAPSRFVLIEERIPTRFDEPLTFLPFASDMLVRCSSKPYLLDVADINYSHYRTSADYEHDLHMTCMKTPYVIGWSPSDGELLLGGLAAWTIDAPRSQVEVGMLEPNGASLQAKLDKMNAAEQQMAVLGARMLEPRRQSVEATATHQIRQAGEQSVLQELAQMSSAHLAKVLQWHAWWMGLTDVVSDERITVELNTDFIPQEMSPQQLEGLVSAWQQRALTQESLWYKLKQGEMLSPDEDLETYIARLSTQAPTLPSMEEILE